MSAKGDFLQARQTFPAVCLQFLSGQLSRTFLRRSQSEDDDETSMHYRVGDDNLGRLDGDGAGVTNHAYPYPNQIELQAGQQQFSQLFGHLDTAQEGGQFFLPARAVATAPGRRGTVR